VRAAEATDLTERITDFVLARRIRREVLEICDAWLASHRPSEAGDPQADEEFKALRYWVLATRGEALFGLEHADANRELEAAYAVAPKGWMRDTTETQIASLGELLATSPLKQLRV